MISKKAVIVVSLVEESADKPNEEVEREIMEELLREPARIPWFEESGEGHGYRSLTYGLSSAFPLFLFEA